MSDLPVGETTVGLREPGASVFGRYRLERVLGQGGMGVVWLAHDAELGVPVALKFIADHLRWDQRALADLRREVLRARALSHPGVVRIHDLLSDPGGTAIAMEYLAGGSLSDRLAGRMEAVPRRALEVADLAPILPLLCATIDFAHRTAGVVHRDLKPSNILLTSTGEPKIADFGVARSLAESTARTSAVLGGGTLAFMGPQQLHDEPPSPSDDIYALGATLYDLLAGSPPFRRGEVTRQIERKTAERMAARRRLDGIEGEAIPEEWEETVAACLAKRAERRPASAGEVAERLLHRPSSGRPTSVPRGRRFRRRAFAVLAATAVVGLAAGTVAYQRWFREARPGGLTAPSDVVRALVAWNFDGDGADGSGRGMHAVVSRALPTTDRFGRIDRALFFNGGAGVTAPDDPRLRWAGAEAFSVSFWVRPAAGAAVVAPLVFSGPEDGGALLWWISLADGRPQFFLSHHPHAGGITVAAQREISGDRWVQIAATSDGRMARLYVAGQLQAERSLDGVRGAPAPRRVRLQVGFEDNAARQVFVGAIDEVRLWRRTLSAAEISALAALPVPPRFAVSTAVFGEGEEVLPGLRAEFGAGAALADWDELRKWHGDDARAWVAELGWGVGAGDYFIGRGGVRSFDATRRYFVTRFDGVVPEYYGVHDEIGGRTVVLGSWKSVQLRALAMLPAIPPRTLALKRREAGEIVQTMAPREVTSALALSWTVENLRGAAGSESVVELRGRDGHAWRTEVQFSERGTVQVAVANQGESPRSRQSAGAFGSFRLELVVRAGRMILRVTNEVGRVPLLIEELGDGRLRASEVAEIRIRGIDAAVLTLE